MAEPPELRDADPPAIGLKHHAAALQFGRQARGEPAPSAANAVVFAAAVDFGIDHPHLVRQSVQRPSL